ncbi:ArsR family transcriptional regulator [Inediibacterium massiliense]|uniref:ArsR family transcriptional regulator n=1 Tax=Inediibacterium massiliense TaxID=1658111 RepID=UPI0006B40C8C|nr:ArsR family transcriptional regulator [Inediibacterium massiliense]
MEENEKLDDLEEKILSYIVSKDKFIGEIEVSLAELAVALENTRASISYHIKKLADKKFLLIKNNGRTKTYIITSIAKDYIESNEVEEFPEDDIKALSYQDALSAKKSIEKINLIKKEMEQIKLSIEQDRKNSKDDIEEIKTEMYGKLQSFYGRIGEILTLIITAIAMIVFNIQLIENVKIDFYNPLLAMQTILAIDLPYLILFVIFITMFHFIIGKDFSNTEVEFKTIIKGVFLRTIPMLLIIIVCFLILLA